jgi:hypothetical protein
MDTDGRPSVKSGNNDKNSVTSYIRRHCIDLRILPPKHSPLVVVVFLLLSITMPFSDLNDDVLRHIALFLAPPYAWRYHLTSASCMREHTSSASASHSNTHTVSPTVFPELPSAHWRTVSLPVGSYYDAAAFRHACRATMRVVPLRRECVEINEGEFPHWLGAREEMLEDIK